MAPDSTTTAAEIGALLAPLVAAPGESAVLLDIDGTLAPIVDDPEAAAVPEETRRLLRALASRYALVGCVSGRRASAARRMVGVAELTYAGNHGLELLDADDEEPRVDPALGRHAGAAAAFVARLDAASLAATGLRLEDKGPIQAIHWRTAPDQELAERRAREIGSLVAEEGLVPHFGRKVLEVRPIAEVDKGTAVRRLVAEGGARHALYAGDDVTDLDAFRALRGMRSSGLLATSVCIGIGSDEGPAELAARADGVVDGPEGLLEVLRALAA